MTFEWTDQAILDLTQMWADGLPCAEIATRLGASKSAIIGKAHRLELPTRPSPIIRQYPVARPVKPRPIAKPKLYKPVPKSPLVILSPNPITACTTRRLCVWPLWEHGARPTHLYCGEPVDPRGIWCAGHWHIGTSRRASEDQPEAADAA